MGTSQLLVMIGALTPCNDAQTFGIRLIESCFLQSRYYARPHLRSQNILAGYHHYPTLSILTLLQ